MCRRVSPLAKVGKGLVSFFFDLFCWSGCIFEIRSIIEKAAGILTVDMFWISKWFGRPDVSHRCKNRCPLDFLIDPLYNIYPTSSFLALIPSLGCQIAIQNSLRPLGVSSIKREETTIVTRISWNLCVFRCLFQPLLDQCCTSWPSPLTDGVLDMKKLESVLDNDEFTYSVKECISIRCWVLLLLLLLLMLHRQQHHHPWEGVGEP